MIRTRDFLVFSLSAAFLLVAIAATVAHDLWGEGATPAAAIEFSADREDISGAVAGARAIDRAANIARLRSKIVAGEGGTPYGAPVFTSVDTVTATDTPVITDATVPESVLIGYALDGSALKSDESWRFVGFGPDEQVGTALNGTPIFGARADGLDACSGADEGLGYRLHLNPDEGINPACFTN